MRHLLSLLAVLTLFGGTVIAQDETKLPKDALFEIKAVKESPVTAIAFSRDSKRMAVGFEDGTVTLNDGTDGKQIAKWNKHKHPVIALRFNRLTKLFSGDADGAIAVVDGKDGEESRNDLFHEEPPNLFDDKRKEKVSAMVFDATGRAVAMARGRFDVKIELRAVHNYEVVQELEGHKQTISTLSFSPDSRYVISSSKDQSVAVWMPSSKRTPRKSVLNINFQPIPDQPYFLASDFAEKRPIAAATIAAQGGDRILLWYYKTGKYIGDEIFNIQQGKVLSMSPDGQTFATAGGDGVVRVWPIPPVTPLRLLRGHGKEISALSFNHNGEWLASGDKYGRVFVWKAVNNKP